jgi:glycosyltransferase involved in cell wall biosynthesis
MTSVSAIGPARPSSVIPPWNGRLLMVANFLNSSVQTRTASEELAMHLRTGGIDVITTSSRVNKATRLADMLWTIWSRRREYSVAQVAVFSGPAFVWAEAACALLRRLGKPYILCLHGGNLPQFAQASGERVRKLLEPANLVTAPSRYLLEQLSAYRPDIRLVPNSIELEYYPYRLRTHARPRLVWLRAFHRIYNPSMAVLVAERLVRKFGDLELIMVGREKDGSKAAAEKLAREKGLERSVKFVGGVPKSEVPDRLAAADIFLNTSSVDNTPVSVIEAMACGLCVVSTDPGGIPYLLENGEDGLVTPVDNPEAMAAAVERVLASPALAERLSGSGRRKVESFDAPAVVSRWAELLGSISGGQHP